MKNQITTRKILLGIFLVASLGYETNCLAQRRLGPPDDCQSWIESTGKEDPSILASWVLGFLSGMNSVVTKPGENDPLAKVTPTQIKLWMDNFCSNVKPTTSTVLGIMTIYSNLQTGELK